MISPYVRRLRLGEELRRRRGKMTTEQLGKKSGVSRQQISRLENGHIPPDMDDILRILDALGVDGDDWTMLTTIAREAGERGWWESIAKNIGERQAMFANLEAGASKIREYQQTLIPGLLQTNDFSRARIERARRWPLPQGTTIEGILKGRVTRQRMLHRPGGGPEYEVILDEFAIRRQPVLPEVFRDQLLRIADSARSDGQVSVRVLLVDAKIEGYNIPSSSFSIYSYPDTGDPLVVGSESLTTDDVLIDPEQVSAYVALFEGLREAALSIEDSLQYLIKAAETLPAQ